MSTPFGVIPEAKPLLVVYIFCTAQHVLTIGDCLMVAASEDGDVLGQHICADPSFAMGDLHNQRGRHEAYAAKFGGWAQDGGEFYKVIQLPVGEQLPEHVAEAIRRKNEEAAAEGGR